MPGFFFDSSALVKRYVEEPGTPRVVDLMRQGMRLVVSHLARVEVASALSRRARQFGLPDDTVAPVYSALESELRDRFEVVELGGAVITRATDLARAHALRAADALQLACALVARETMRADPGLTLVSSDAELNAAAAHEGLAICDPTQG
jgi:hypothetical protein